MDYPNLQELRRQNPKAANEMVASIARGVHAGNMNMNPQAAAKKAVETAEESLRLIAPDPTKADTDTDDGGGV